MIRIEGKNYPVIAAAPDLVGDIHSDACKLSQTPVREKQVRNENKEYGSPDAHRKIIRDPFFRRLHKPENRKVDQRNHFENKPSACIKALFCVSFTSRMDPRTKTRII